MALSGAQKRKVRVAAGLPKYGERELASKRARNKQRYATQAPGRYQERLAFLADYKLRAGCADCGYRAHPAALEFDHPEGRHGGRTVASIAADNLRSGSQVRLLAEIAKCQVVCANCHRIRTHERREQAKA